MTDTDRVSKALKIYSDVMRVYMLDKLKAHYGAGKEWLEAYLSSFRSESRVQGVIETLKNSGKPEDAFDINHVKDLLLAHKHVFGDDFKRSLNKAATWAEEVTDVRNKWAHQEDIPADDVTRSLDSISRILISIGAEDKAQTVKGLRDGVLPEQVVSQAVTQTVTQTPTQTPTQTATQTPSALPEWWRFADPHEDIKKGGFDESTFAARLDDVVKGKASPEYGRADEFFAKTYLTEELKGLLADTLRRLAGTGGEAVVQLRTPFGGGKTHALIALYHLVKAAADVEDMADVRELLRGVGLEHVPHARTAVIVGTDAEVGGYSPEAGVTIHTLWGELAYQLGGSSGFEVMRESDAAQVAPTKSALAALFSRYGKVLVLLDELLVYQVRAAGVRVGETSLQAQTFAFLQALTEAVGSTPGVALVTTFPESHIEYYDAEGAQGAFDRLNKIFGRVEATRVPVQGEEIFEVVRRRLFSGIDEEGAGRTVAAYRKLYEQHQHDLPSGARSGAYAARMKRAYPFHPELIDVLYERWGTLQSFQKTRGVLTLLARIIEFGYRSGHAGPLIGLGEVGLEDPQLRATITHILRGTNWDPVIVSDIVPEEGKAFVLDRERGGEYAKLRLAQTVVTAIFMYAHSGGGERGVGEPRLRLSLIRPGGVTPTLLSDALARLKGRLYYLYGDGSWTFRAQANLNAVLSERMGQIEARAVRERLGSALASKAGGGVLKPYLWPESHKDVPDTQGLKLVVLSPEAAVGSGELERLMDTIQNNHASGPRINKNGLLYLAGRAEDFSRVEGAARTLLALEDIERDRGLSLSDDQRRDLTERLNKARSSLPEAAKACYNKLYEPLDAASRDYRVHDVSAPVKTSPTLTAAATEVLRGEDRLLNALDPALIISGPYGLWPEEDESLPLRNLREYFLRFPHLPYLENDDVLRDAVVRGVKNGLFEAGLKEMAASKEAGLKEGWGVHAGLAAHEPAQLRATSSLPSTTCSRGPASSRLPLQKPFHHPAR